MATRFPLVALVVCALAPAASAQQVQGSVLLADSATPAASVIVEAVREGGGEPIRVLTGARGTFRLALPGAGTYRLRGLRVGYQPTTFAQLALGAGETRTVLWVLRGLAVNVAAIRVDSAEICGRNADEGEAVGSLLMQARTALAATLLSSPDGQSQASWKTFRVITDREGTPLTPVVVAADSGSTDRPFRTVGIDRLESEGYVHAQGGRVEFRSPDAEVLLSESFMASHCFRRASETVEGRDWVGVAFTPVPRARGTRSGLVDVRGVLWLERESAELRRLDFGYVGLPEAVAAAQPGGSVQFRRIPSGTWLVDRWTLRMPRAAAVRLAQGTTQLTVPAIEFKGGVVEEIRRGDVVERGTPFDVETALPLLAMRAGVAPTCEADRLAEPEDRGLVYGTLRDAGGNPVADGVVRATWRLPSTALRNRDQVMEREVQVTDGFFIMCGLPVVRRFDLEARGPGGAMPSRTMRLRSARPHASLELRLAAEP